jgi:hypothetical protein
MSWLGKLFGRKAPTPVDLRGWNEDWQVGDLAVCIEDEWGRVHCAAPVKGDVLRVSALMEGCASTGNKMISGLRFEGKPQNLAWHCGAFRKIRPEVNADEVETGIIQQIKRAAKRGQPKRVQA